jgi:hypothetical protein
MSRTSKIFDASTLDAGQTYNAFYIENLNNRLCRQIGIVSGEDAAKMLATSADPRRLHFTEAK